MIRNKYIYVVTKRVKLAGILKSKCPDMPLRVITVQNSVGEKLSRLTRHDEEALQEAEVVLADPDLAVHFDILPHKYTNIKYLQTVTVGVDLITKNLHPSVRGTFTLGHVGGCMGHLMSEYVIGHIIAHEWNFAQQQENQNNRIWKSGHADRHLNTLSLGILGLGDLGKDLGKCADTFGMEVWGLVTKRVPKEQRLPYIKQYRTTDELSELLSSCDYIVNLLPSTNSTRGMLNGDMLRHGQCKRSIFINVGRGDVVDERSILTALDSDWLRHVILDVFDPEPLSRDSPLWQHPKVTISPHTSAYAHPDLICNSIISNYKRFISGEKLDYEMDWEKGY